MGGDRGRRAAADASRAAAEEVVHAVVLIVVRRVVLNGVAERRLPVEGRRAKRLRQRLHPGQILGVVGQGRVGGVPPALLILDGLIVARVAIAGLDDDEVGARLPAGGQERRQRLRVGGDVGALVRVAGDVPRRRVQPHHGVGSVFAHHRD